LDHVAQWLLEALQMVPLLAEEAANQQMKHRTMPKGNQQVTPPHDFAAPMQ
jgi:hypothetical protein